MAENCPFEKNVYFENDRTYRLKEICKMPVLHNFSLLI
ncbi:MAG: hypothetical protein LBM13_05480 [Candidatus Ancillula sp.]|nr:hypothetical protein [Candidatus Ancillula sp.]